MKTVSEVIKEDASKPGLRMGETPSWDSVAHMDLVFRLEQSFDIGFDIDTIAELDTVPALKEAVKGLCAK
jgi:acyl carrier protein